MRLNSALAAVATIAAIASAPAYAYEPGGAPAQAKAGVLFGASAGVPPPGIYMFNQVFTYQSNLVGPFIKVIGKNVGVQTASDVQGFLFVPGWTFLGATYDAVIALPFGLVNVGSPIPSQFSGVHNTFFAPVELSWKLGDSGFQIKTGLGIFAPDGTITGVGGLGNFGSPFWTFQPEVIVSYLKDGWNLSAAFYEEFNTANSITGYRTGDILHADFTATKRIGKWTIGPVAYYVGQVSNDTSSTFYHNALGTQRYDAWAVGALVGYDFGPAALSVWATQEVAAHASGATVIGGVVDPSTTSKGFTVFATLSYRVWAPEETPAPRKPMIYK